jgi:transposase
LTAFGLATEVGDWQRFSGATIGAYLGLVPSEASSGAQRVQGSITKTGNTHARRLQVEAAWHHRRPFTGHQRTPGHAGNQPAHIRLTACRYQRPDHAAPTAPLPRDRITLLT